MSDNVLWYTSRGAGAVSEILLTGVVVLGILSALRVQSATWPRFLTAGLHRNLALTAVVFLTLHIVTAIVDPFTSLGLAALIPFGSYYRTVWLGLGAIAFELLCAIVVTSLVRDWIGLRAWRAIHFLSYAVWPIAIAHGLGTGTDSWSVWMLGVTGGCAGAVVVALAWRLTTAPRDPLAAARLGFRAAVDRREPR